MNLPNALSLLRIFLVTPFLIAVIYHQFFVALIIFVLAGISDFFDGYLARRWRQQSLLGTFLDPLGDKLLITVAFISLCIQGLLPPWLVVTVVAKDVYSVIGTGVLYFSDNFSVAIPSLWGKLSTLLQIIAVGFALLSAFCTINTSLLDGLFAVTGLATAIAFFHYLWRGVEVFSAVTSHQNGP
ncbi:MAG: CDP-alcohol phosphatidyltransferase family protein [Deltaproteobacteria bacterium]|nr:CDP-alcohol phosphatidyltransferase family protein [Deltaproteobacteria bacterium]